MITPPESWDAFGREYLKKDDEKLNKSNLMLRLIDVVFILLFGFIAVSQIGSSVSIEPPKSSEAMETAPDDDHIVIVGVTKEGTYPVDSDLIFTSLSQLRLYIVQKAREAEKSGTQLGVRIRANWDAPVEYAMAVAKLCRDMGLAKGLDVVKLNSN